ncbi:MarR family transcriptional regulator [Corallococcus sp. CA053C]|nr:MarR family transcriptional regulator [Corallococcus sp. CA053C]
MTGLADRMVRAGLIDRRTDPEDKRISRLWLTRLGREVGTHALAELGALNATLTEGFTDAEMAVVSRWLAAVHARFD